MKVLMLNTFDETGGAARAAVRLLRGVREHNIDAKLLVQFKTGSKKDVICNHDPLRKLFRRLKVFLGLLPVRLYPNKPENNFSPSLLPDNKPAEISRINPDIIHLHWLCAGYMRIETLAKLNKPLIWTLHDSWAFTGGCHVPFDCKKYQQSCGACPVLGSARQNDLSRRTWERKAKAWKDLDLTVITPSRWLADCARSSSLLRDARVEVIPNGLDTGTFYPGDREQARNLLRLPMDRKIILFGAAWADSDTNKGLHLLKGALQVLAKDSSDLMTLLFGADDFAEMKDLGMPAVCLGRIYNDESLAAIYSAADVFVAPSMLENFPNTVMEAMACGTPCVAFRQGGVPDLIEHNVSGYLAEPYEIKDLAQGIAWVLEDKARHAELSRRSCLRVETRFDLNKIAQRYSDLYQKQLNK
jgi:glycosyltransferase involved in cell wall biosynthesis